MAVEEEGLRVFQSVKIKIGERPGAGGAAGSSRVSRSAPPAPRVAPGDARFPEALSSPAADCWAAAGRAPLPSWAPAVSGLCPQDCPLLTSPRPAGPPAAAPSPPLPEVGDWAEPGPAASGTQLPEPPCAASGPKSLEVQCGEWGRLDVAGWCAVGRGWVPSKSVCLCFSACARVETLDACISGVTSTHLRAQHLLSCCTQKLPFL